MSPSTDRQKEFRHAIVNTIEGFGMLEHKDRVLVAVSGGPDSVALLLCLLAVKQIYALEMGIAHLNHQLRGTESDRDETFARKLAVQFNLVFYGQQTNVRAYARDRGLSLEEAGREVRYSFFEQVARAHGYTKIATGHNQDDNVELVLMNLLRGAGPKGLSGIPPVRENCFIRPLIQVSKNQILDFLKARDQDYMTDSSNTDMRYLRNRLRFQLIPQLQTEYNPEIKDALDRLSHIMRQEDACLAAAADRHFNACLIGSDASAIVFSKNRLSMLPPALMSRVLRKAILKIKKDLKRISHGHVTHIIEFCFRRLSGTSLDLPGQIRVYKNKDQITIRKEDRPLRTIGKQAKQSRQAAQKK